MILDAFLQFTGGQTLSGDAVSENVIDLKDARDIGVGEKLYIVVSLSTTLDGTLQVNLEKDDSDAFGSPVVQDIGSLAAAAPAGSQLVYALSPGVADERYIRLDFNGATAGEVKAHIVKDADLYTNYPDAITIS